MSGGRVLFVCRVCRSLTVRSAVVGDAESDQRGPEYREHDGDDDADDPGDAAGLQKAVAPFFFMSSYAARTLRDFTLQQNIP